MKNKNLKKWLNNNGIDFDFMEDCEQPYFYIKHNDFLITLLTDGSWEVIDINESFKYFDTNKELYKVLKLKEL